MRVLLVEDDDSHAARFIGLLEGLSVDRVASRNAAEEALEGGAVFDLVVCDLRIPVHNDGIDRSAQHGLAVQATCARLLPGTPTIFLTGVAEDHIDEWSLVTSGGDVSDDLADGKPLEMVRLFRKDRVLDCAQFVLDIRSRLVSLDEISITGEDDLLASLTPQEARALRLVARQWSGVDVTVRSLGGGLSGGTTLHARVRDDVHDRSSVFLKIDHQKRCRDERARYHEFVVGTVSHDAFPDFAHLLSACLGDRACLVYKFADDWTGSFFAQLESGIDLPEVVIECRELLSTWESMAETRHASPRQVRESVIGLDRMTEVIRAHEEDSEELLELVNAWESKQIDIKVLPQHGDLHGENILLTKAGRPTMIDCGDIGMHPAGLDPVTLELSLVLHPSSPFRDSEWPTPEQARQWRDVDTYAAGCPVEPLVRACRQWAIEVAGEEGLVTAGYQHVIRQLKYADTPKPIVLGLLRGLLTE